MKPAHAFTYATTWLYLDLDEWAAHSKKLWPVSKFRFAPAAFRRADHLGDAERPLIDCVRSLVLAESGITFDGPVRILTQLSHFGFYFSPINVYYCFDNQENVVAMVAEVSNTPWNERHCYVLWDGNRVDGSGIRYSHPKAFHVSPFMGMDSVYQWRMAKPADRLVVSLGCDREGDRIFQALMQLERQPLTNFSMLRSLARRPVAAFHLLGAIYFQALRLWMKRCQFFPHPGSPKQPIANLQQTANPLSTDRRSRATKASPDLQTANSVVEMKTQGMTRESDPGPSKIVNRSN
jgi:DUF1365 family protein